MSQIREMTVLRKATLSRKELLWKLRDLDLGVLLCTSPECINSRRWRTISLLTIEIYTRLCEIPPLPRSELLMISYKTSNWTQICSYTYLRPRRTEYIPDYYSKDEIKQSDGRDYNAEFLTKLYYREISWRKYRLRLDNPELHNYCGNWQLHIDLRIKPFQSIFPIKPYETSRRRSNDFQKRVMTVPDSQTTPTANCYRTGSAGTKHREIHSPIEKSSSGKCTWRWID